MIPHNGYSLLFVALCITVGYANDSEESISTLFDLEQGKHVDIAMLQHKLEQLSERRTTKKPRKSRPPHRPYPTTMYWPPYPPPHHYPPPPHYPPDYPPEEYYPPSTKRPRPYSPRPSSGPKDRRDRLIREYCQDRDNKDLLVCSDVCRDYPNIAICEPICSISSTYAAKPYCSVDCIVDPRDRDCDLPDVGDDIPPGCPPRTSRFVEDCFLYCQTYPRDTSLPWCETQRRLLPN